MKHVVHINIIKPNGDKTPAIVTIDEHGFTITGDGPAPWDGIEVLTIEPRVHISTDPTATLDGEVVTGNPDNEE